MPRRAIASGFAGGSDGLPVVDMIEVSERTAARVRDRERLRDHAAERRAEHVRARELQ